MGLAQHGKLGSPARKLNAPLTLHSLGFFIHRYGVCEVSLAHISEAQSRSAEVKAHVSVLISRPRVRMESVDPS